MTLAEGINGRLLLVLKRKLSYSSEKMGTHFLLIATQFAGLGRHADSLTPEQATGIQEGQLSLYIESYLVPGNQDRTDILYFRASFHNRTCH